MFKKVLQSLGKTFAGWDDAKTVSSPPPTGEEGKSLLDKINAPPPAASQPQKARPSSPLAELAQIRAKSPEDICGVTTKMSKDDIKARLALLYRRYNRATSSLDPKLRAEAETMLDAIVALREKNFGPI